MSNTSPITPIVVPELPARTLPSTAGSGFGDLLSNAIQNVEATQQNAKAAAADFLYDGKGDVHNVALAAQRAELSMELFQQVRNKFVQAYQEIMKMPM